MERTLGIEPKCPAWKAGALPLSHVRIMMGTGPIPWQQQFPGACRRAKINRQGRPALLARRILAFEVRFFYISTAVGEGCMLNILSSSF